MAKDQRMRNRWQAVVSSTSIAFSRLLLLFLDKNPLIPTPFYANIHTDPGHITAPADFSFGIYVKFTVRTLFMPPTQSHPFAGWGKRGKIYILQNIYSCAIQIKHNFRTFLFILFNIKTSSLLCAGL